MFGIGETELLIIVAFGFMIFGPDKLPGMGRTLGRALRQFRQAQEGFTEVVQTEVMDPLQEAMGDPLDTGTRKQRRATAEERAAALAADADIDAREGAAPRKETFAERKARLAAEREAREAERQAAEAAEAADAADATGAEADADAEAAIDATPAQSAPDPEPEPEPAPKPEPEVPDTSAAALYAMGGRSSFAAAKEAEAAEAAAKEAAEAAAKEAEAAEAAAKEAEAAEEVADEQPSAEEAPAATGTDGEEAGSTEA